MDLECVFNILSTVSQIVLVAVVFYTARKWAKREKWVHDQKDARSFLRKLTELKFHINKARRRFQTLPHLTDSLLDEKGIKKRVADLLEQEKRDYAIAILYSDLFSVDEAEEYKIDLENMKGMVSVLNWDGDFINNIKYLNVLIAVFENHIQSHIEGSYFYWDIEKYKKCKEKGEENAWGSSIIFFSKEDEDENEKQKAQRKQSRNQRSEVLFSGAMFDSSSYGNENFFDKELRETFDKLFTLLSEKIKRP